MSAHSEPILHKAVACVVRETPRGPELLVFDHPLAGTQVAKGTMDDGEGVIEAALRELHEESGLRDVEPLAILGTWTRHLGTLPREDGVPKRHDWHVVKMRPTRELPERWEHVAHGSPEEEGLVFAYRWVPLDAGVASRLHPLFAEVTRMLVESVA